MPERIRSGRYDRAAQAPVMAWNLMGGELNWTALPIVVDILGIDDPETLIHQLIQIRDQRNEPES